MRIAVIALFGLLAGCGDPTSPEAGLAGTYHLQTVNGQALPYVAFQSGPNSITILSDQIVVAEGGTWSEIASYRLVDNGVTTNQTASDGGQWLRAGSQLTLYSDDGSTSYAGTIAKDRMTFNDGTFVQVFVK